MLFSSITFLFGFLPIVLILYYISPRAFRNMVLMLVSLFFYAWGEPVYVIIMIFSILVAYILGLLTGSCMRKCHYGAAKLVTALAVALNLIILIYFKYIGFFVENISALFGIKPPVFDISLPYGINFSVLSPALPLGISFYTFQILSYSVDVYRKTVSPQKNFINLAAYVTLFPQLIAGPIVRYETVAAELEERHENTDDFGEGARRFIVGLGKKVLLANVAGELFDTLSVLPQSENTIVLSWICSVAYSVQIYYDFSGYSDMAIGLGRMLGFHFLENFNYPYISGSATEFWRRWHISLSTWFRDYVYIPLGGNRGGRARTVRNIFIVWLLTGFWHGAEWNFVIWGLYYFIILMLEKNGFGKILERLPAVVRHIYALLVINIGWVIFSYDDIHLLKRALSNMFGMNGLPVISRQTVYYIVSYGIFLIMAFVGTTPFPTMLAKRFAKGNTGGRAVAAGAAELVYLFAVLLLCTAFLAGNSFNPFLYFRF